MVVLKAAVLEGSINEQWHRQSPLAVHLARVWSTTARLVSQIGPEPERGGSTGKDVKNSVSLLRLPFSGRRSLSDSASLKGFCFLTTLVEPKSSRTQN